MRKFDETCKESLSTAELSEMLVDYAQINERLEAENKRLKSDNKRLRSENKHLEKAIEQLQHKYSVLERDALSICKAIADGRVTVRAAYAYYQLMYPDDYAAELEELKSGIFDLADIVLGCINEENEQ